LSRLKQDLLSIRSAALQAVDPAAAVRRHLSWQPPRLLLGETAWELQRPVLVRLLAAGKAAAPMAGAFLDLCGEAGTFDSIVSAGLVITKYEHARGYTFGTAVQVIEAGHPTPDEAGLYAAQTAYNFISQAGPDEKIVLLLSGGASALLPLPAAPVSLADLQELTGRLLRAGANIGELNAVRKHLDLLKGGQMARLVAGKGKNLVALVLSDVVGDPLDVIASGPTVPDPTTFQDAWKVLQRYALLDSAPASVLYHLQAGLRGELPETPKPGDPIFAATSSQVIASNRLAACAAVEQAQRLGYHSLLLSTWIEGEARELGRVTAGLIKSVLHNSDPLPPPACLVLGGETTVTVRGSGKGGRNQELALAAAIALDGIPHAALMSLATDGSDGPTDSSGGLVDGDTCAEMRRLGLDPQAALANNDSYIALQVAGAQMYTGPTGTNVNDLVVILVGSPI
jgi:glycerate 2-kinase